MATETLKNSYRLQKMAFKLSKKGKKITERKAENYVFIGNGISRGWERNSTTRRFETS